MANCPTADEPGGDDGDDGAMGNDDQMIIDSGVTQYGTYNDTKCVVVPNSNLTMLLVEKSTSNPDSRRLDTLEEMAARKLDARFMDHNGTSYMPFIFSKTLEHNPVTYMAKTSDVEKLISGTGCMNETCPAINDIELSSSSERKMEGLYVSGHKRVRFGYPIGRLDIPAPLVTSAEGWYDMIAVYWQNILGSEAFNAYSDPDSDAVQTAIAELNEAAEGADISPSPITARNLFRGNFPGVEHGPYVSQFLMLDYKMGNSQGSNKVELDSYQASQKDPETYLKIQNGAVPNPEQNKNVSVYIFNGASLGSCVHNDAFYQLYFNACLIGQQQGVKLEDHLVDGSPSTQWLALGFPDLLAAVASSARTGLQIAWPQKWFKNLKIRPEAMAMRMAQMTNSSSPDVRAALRAIVNDDFLSKLESFNETRKWATYIDPNLSPNEQEIPDDTPEMWPLLEMLYPEGSPTHPSYPAGHAAVAGAVVTVMKAFSVTHEGRTPLPWPSTAYTSDDGINLIEVDSTEAASMTINGELNKLAQNVEAGRVFAGVHYPSDESGIILGEDVSLAFMADMLSDYSLAGVATKDPSVPLEQLSPKLNLQLFNGTFVEITRFGVTEISPVP